MQRLRVETLISKSREGDLRAREELVRHYVPLAKRLAGRYGYTSELREDLEQVAYLGLIKAIDRYDPELGSFDRYAVPKIMNDVVAETDLSFDEVIEALEAATSYAPLSLAAPYTPERTASERSATASALRIPTTAWLISVRPWLPRFALCRPASSDPETALRR